MQAYVKKIQKKIQIQNYWLLADRIYITKYFIITPLKLIQRNVNCDVKISSSYMNLIEFYKPHNTYSILICDHHRLQMETNDR